jgi:predicted AAA+ superfamily ATPase
MVLRGARQVGKTTAVEIFAARFDRFLYFNLERQQDSRLFEGDLPFADLLEALFLARNAPRRGGRTLLFLDEIQGSPRAMSCLRCFQEAAPDLFVAAAGSLLEVMLARAGAGFPVGRVEYLFMHPLSFEEYLQALDMESALKAYLTVPCPAYAHETLLPLFHRYAQVGGMPEVVSRYRDEQEIMALAPIYQGLVTSFLDDIGKYAKSGAMTRVLRFALETAPLEAGKRIKFQGFGRSAYRSREMGEALRILEQAMLVRLIYPVTATRPPALPDLKKSPRLQYLDTGLLNYSAGLQQSLFTMKDLHSIYQGILAEHVVAQELTALGAQSAAKPVFWVREKQSSTAEVDFLFPYRELLIPVEVKAGKSGTLRSLHQFMDACDHPWAIRLYAGPLRRETARTRRGKEFQLLNLPYFLAGKLRDYLEHIVG